MIRVNTTEPDGSAAKMTAEQTIEQRLDKKRLELTPRALITAAFVAALIGATYPYVVLKIGYGPNISVVSAFFGYIALTVVGFFTGVRGTRWENNLVQTAGTAAGEAGFMCVVLAAMDMLNQRPELGFSVHLDRWQIFWWLSIAGMLGVLLAGAAAQALHRRGEPHLRRRDRCR